LRHPKIDRQNLTAWINGELQLEERYAGHQFGVFAGQLGDGRAITLGKFPFGDQHLEIQTKGSGLTIDYGPYGFMEDFNLSHICNHSDHQGRYAYNQQPKIGWWNLERLFVSFLPFHPQEKLEQLLNEYPRHFEHYYVEDAKAKLGLLKKRESDYQLYVDLLKVLNTHAVDMTFFFRALSRYQMEQESSMAKFLSTMESWREYLSG
jgi:uncharacterized protein YdiU (UPF0061 family)